MIYKIFGISELPHLFNFRDISVTFIVIYSVAFTENLFYSTCCYSYWVLILQLYVEAAATGQLHCTRHRKWCLLFPQTSSQASIPHDQPHCTADDGNLNFFLRASVMCTWIVSEQVAPGETERWNLPTYVISASSLVGPKIQWFLYSSCFIPGDVTKLAALCQMLDVF